MESFKDLTEAVLLKRFPKWRRINDVGQRLAYIYSPFH